MISSASALATLTRSLTALSTLGQRGQWRGLAIVRSLFPVPGRLSCRDRLRVGNPSPGIGSAVPAARLRNHLKPASPKAQSYGPVPTARAVLAPSPRVAWSAGAGYPLARRCQGASGLRTLTRRTVPPPSAGLKRQPADAGTAAVRRRRAVEHRGRNTESTTDWWLAARIAPPDAGMFSAPVTFGRQIVCRASGPARAAAIAARAQRSLNGAGPGRIPHAREAARRPRCNRPGPAGPLADLERFWLHYGAGLPAATWIVSSSARAAAIAARAPGPGVLPRAASISAYLMPSSSARTWRA